MQVQIQATTLSLPANEIAAAIPPEVLAGIRKKDPAPYFQAYSIVQEGRSAPRVLGEGRSILIWPRRAVEAVGALIKRGIQFFKGHGADNSTAGRPALGEVVGALTKTIGGAMHQIAIGYFPDRKTAEDFDICSIEANALMEPAGPGNFIVSKLADLTGIALANSREDSPAFPGAVRLGTLQAFEPHDDDPTDPPPGDSSKNKITGGDPIMTFDEVKKAVRDLNIHPGQLFDLDMIRSDRVFGPLIQKGEAHEKTIKGLQDEIQNRDTTIATLKKADAVKGARDRLSKFMPEGLTEKQREFISKRFAPEKMPEVTDEALASFVKTATDEYADMAKLFNADGAAAGGGAPGAGDAGGGTADQGGGSALDGGSPVDQVVNAITKT